MSLQVVNITFFLYIYQTTEFNDCIYVVAFVGRDIKFTSLIDIHLLLTAYFVHFSYCNLHLKYMLGMGMAEFQLKDH